MIAMPFDINIGSIDISIHACRVSCGFPSPADSYLESPLTLADLLVKNPSATYFVKAQGHSMIGKGILDGAILTVDRSKPISNMDIVIAVVNGEMTCKIIDTRNNLLLAANPKYSAIPITDSLDVIIQGVVTFAINPL
jgi:DNA polymerase V